MRVLSVALVAGFALGFLLPMGSASGHCDHLSVNSTSQAGPLCCCFPWNGTGTVHLANSDDASHQTCVLASCNTNCTNPVIIGSQCKFVPESGGGTEDFNIGADKVSCTGDHSATAEFSNGGNLCGDLARTFTWDECSSSPCN